MARFAGDIQPSRVRILKRGRPTLPVPTPWNYRRPLDILDAIFWDADAEDGDARHNRYLTAPGILGLVTRDPQVIKAVLLATGDKPGQFDRDPWPARGIARATGEDSMLYANGAQWRMQKRLAAPSFSRSSLFQPERFGEFEKTFRRTIASRLDALRHAQAETGADELEIELEAEISAVMLEMLVNNFFGADVAYEELRERYVPAIQGLIQHMVRDTVRPGPPPRSQARQVAAWRRDFEHLTDIVLEGRRRETAAWAQFRSDAPDDALRSNLRVFLAGALEATTSLAAWTLAHLARRPDIQDRILSEIRDLDHYDPDNLGQAVMLGHAIDETLRLTPALYFLPRRATKDTWIETGDGRRFMIPKATRVILDVWHANRNEEFWGEAATGYPALAFEPARWPALAKQGRNVRDTLHFGFGHGARVCPGRFLGLMEVGLVVGAFVKVFRFHAEGPLEPRAGVSTKPSDGAKVRLSLRDPP